MVGSGPAGLTAARFALLGHAVTVYESAPVMGGCRAMPCPTSGCPRMWWTAKPGP
ncbi:MAG: NAD(P)-binding protein [Bilophila wadsworthia]